MKFSRRSFANALVGSSLVLGTGTPPAVPDEGPEPAAGQWQPQFFSEHEAETFASLADIIIPATDTPGAREALVHQHADKILYESVSDVQTGFLQGLWWLDGYSLRTHSKPFRALPLAGQETMAAQLLEASVPELAPGRAFIESAKSLVSHVYYSTEIGERELNKGGRIPATYLGHAWNSCIHTVESHSG